VLIDLTCPIELWHFKLPDEQDSFVRLQLYNLQEKKVVSVLAAFVCYNQDGEKLSRQIIRVRDLMGHSHHAFEMVCELDDGLQADAIDLTIQKVWFEDGTLWRRMDKNAVEYKEVTPLEGEELEQLQLMAGDDAVNYPSDQGTVWLCVCGRPNGADDASCMRCRREKHAAFTNFNQAAVQRVLIEKKNAEEEEERKRQEKEEKLAALKKRKLERRLKFQKRLRIGFAAVVILAGLAAAAKYWALPAYHYRQNSMQLMLGEYEQAKEGFLLLGDYKDSPTMVMEADYLGALEQAKLGTFTALKAAETTLEGLGDYRDSASELLGVRYLRAQSMRKGGDYEGAKEVFLSLEGYSDAATQVKETDYLWAKALMTQLKYEEARAKFIALGDYDQAATLQEQCALEAAENAAIQKDYLGAIGWLEQIPESILGQSRLTEIRYLYAGELFSQGLYAQAAEQFLAVGDYQDAWDRATECLYQPALEKMQGKDYLAAKEMFDKIPAFRDAAQLSQQCAYEQGLIDLRDKNYEQAILLLDQAKTIPLAGMVLQEAHLVYGQQLLSEKDYEKAAAHFDLAGDYESAKENASRARYMLGEEKLASGDLDKAVEVFIALGTYEDSADKLKQALYERARQALEAGEYTSAISQFEALDRHLDSQEKLQVSYYQLGRQLFDKAEYQAAAEHFLKAGDYSDAKEKYDASIYADAKAKEADGLVPEAAALYAQIPHYLDAKAKWGEISYAWAMAQKEQGDYLTSALAFSALGDYGDARLQAQSAYDTYYLKAVQTAKEAYNRKEYQKAVDALKDLDLQNLPEAYQEAGPLYRDSVYALAEYYYNQGKPYLALPYYRELADDPDVVSRKLSRNSYRVLGKWESSKGLQMEFREDGTCTIDGKDYYFSAVQYSLSLGDSELSLRYAYNISRVTDNSLTLIDAKTNRIFKMSRIK
jgi:tetratricopeptide (TPR) repeat protein